MKLLNLGCCPDKLDSERPRSGHHVKAAIMLIKQRWSRRLKARGQGQGHKKNPRPRTGMFEAKAKDQGHKRKCSPKKKGLYKNFSGDLQKKKGLHKNFSSDLHKKTFSKKFFQRSTKF